MNVLSKSRLPLFAFAAAFGLAVVAAPSAQAFTMEDQGGTNPDGSAKYADPEARRFGSSATSKDGQTTIRQGNTTLQFGSQRPSNERYNVDRMFNPNGRPGDDR